MAADYLASRIRLGVKFGLDTMRGLMAALDHPERAFPVLVVAGTNGKGSVAAYVDAVLRAGGLAVGRYTSPHLVRVNERIVVAGRALSDRALHQAVRRVRDATEALRAAGALPGEPTYFEVLTHLAFAWFAEQHVDVAVVEVGLRCFFDLWHVPPCATCSRTRYRRESRFVRGELRIVRHPSRR